MVDPIGRLRSLPKAGPPNDDVSQVRGDCTDEVKQLNMNILAHYAGCGAHGVFGSDQAKHLKLVEANLKHPKADAPNLDKPDTIQAEAIYEIEVKEGMLNHVSGTVAGACLMHLLDVCTFGALFALGVVVNKDVGGVSLAMDVKYYAPTLPGMVLRIVATTMSIKERLLHSRGEIYEKATGKLLASGVHTIIQARSHRDRALKVPSKL